MPFIIDYQCLCAIGSEIKMFSGVQLGQAISEAIKRKNVSQKEVADHFGVKQPSVSGWIKNGRIDKKHLDKLIDYFSDVVTPSHFGIETFKVLKSNEESSIRFPRLNAEATCGAGTINDHYIEVVDYVTVAAAWAREKLGGNLNKIQVITARGDSMEPTIEDGDVMFVDTAIEAFEGDGLYLLWYIDGLKAKRLQSTVGGGLMIISDNNSYRTETVRGEDLNAVHIIGRIRGAWRLSQF